MSPQAFLDAGECDQGVKSAGQFVVLHTEPTFFYEPAEEPFDNVMLIVWRPGTQSRQTWLKPMMYLAQRNHQLHAVAVAVLTQELAVITFFGQHIAATLTRATLVSWQADLIQQWHEVAQITLRRGQHNSQRQALGPFFPTPLAGRVT